MIWCPIVRCLKSFKSSDNLQGNSLFRPIALSLSMATIIDSIMILSLKSKVLHSRNHYRRADNKEYCTCLRPLCLHRLICKAIFLHLTSPLNSSFASRFDSANCISQMCSNGLPQPQVDAEGKQHPIKNKHHHRIATKEAQQERDREVSADGCDTGCNEHGGHI